MRNCRMSRYTAAREHDHRRPGRTAVLLVQLGTPDAPTAPAVRRYLAEFLSDPRVVEIPRVAWWPLLHGVILRTRPRRSAAKYAAIWTDRGSPLAVHTRVQAELLRGFLGEAGQAIDVRWAMRYGEPSIAGALRALRDDGLERLLVLPMYPQYAASTTATVYDVVFRELAHWRNPPELRLVKHFHDFAPYVEALAEGIERTWRAEGRPERLLMSFHGLPRRALELGDPYHCECHVTARLLAERLGLAEDQWQLAFQSRFGRAAWLQPYTDATLAAWARQGVRRVDVVCPGFVADCLETLEEVAIEGRQTFLAAGGEAFRYLGCPNDSPAFIRALVELVGRHVGGWPVHRLTPPEAAADESRREARRQRAMAAGAPR